MAAFVPGGDTRLPSPSLERSSGIIFTTKLIDILCDQHSPFLQGDQDIDFSKCRRSLKPSGRKHPAAVDAYHDFRQAIVDTCIQRSDEMANKLQFHFTPSDFESEAAWTERNAAALVKYDEKRSQRENHEQECRFGHFNKAHNPKARLRPSQENRSSVGHLGERSGALASPTFSPINAVRSIVRDFVEVCPGISSEGTSGYFHKSIRAAVSQPDDGISPEMLCKIVRGINWRSEQLNWADNIVLLLQLKRPYNQEVRTWCSPLWETKHVHCSERYQMAQLHLTRAKIFEDPEMRSLHEDYGYEWHRPRKYVAAAVALSSRDAWEVSVRVCQIVELFDDIIRRLVEELIWEPSVRESAIALFRHLGKIT
jgi:hypothetical protein